MKSSHLRVGRGCSIENMSVALYDTEMQPGSSLAPLSLLMKKESFPPDTRWVGIPIEPIHISAPVERVPGLSEDSAQSS